MKIIARILYDVMCLIKSDKAFFYKYIFVIALLSSVAVIEIAIVKLLVFELFNGSVDLTHFEIKDGIYIYSYIFLLLLLEFGRFWAKTKNIQNLNKVVEIFRNRIGFVSNSEGWYRALLIEIHIYLVMFFTVVMLLFAIVYLLGWLGLWVSLIVFIALLVINRFYFVELKNQSEQGSQQELVARKIESRIRTSEKASLISTYLLYLLLTFLLVLYLSESISLELLVVSIFAIRILSTSLRSMSSSLMRVARAVIRSQMFGSEVDQIIRSEKPSQEEQRSTYKGSSYVNRFHQLRKELIEVKKRNRRLETRVNQQLGIKEKNIRLKEELSFLQITASNLEKTKKKYSKMIRSMRYKLQAKEKTEAFLRGVIKNRKEDIYQLQNQNNSLRNKLKKLSMEK